MGRVALILVAGYTGLLAAPSRAHAVQDHQPGTPEAVADEFLRGFGSMAWAGLVQRIHPEGLAYLRIASDILVDVDSTAYTLDRLLGGVAPDDYATLPDDEVIRRLLGGVQREAPGLLSSLVARRAEVLGSVPDGERRHAVYRIVALLSGAQPRIQVMTLEQHEDRWRVVDADDLRLLQTAIRGIPIPPGPARPGGDPRS